MGRRKKHFKIDTAAFRELDMDYQLNEYHDRMVDALNQLPTDERSIMIIYIGTNMNKAEVARILGASGSFCRYKITAIQNKLKEIIKNQSNDDE